MANRYWFRPRTRGYGPTPASWEGRLVTAAYYVFLLFLVWGVPFLYPVGGTFWHVAILAVGMISATGLMFWVVRHRTKGDIRWRHWW